LAAAAASFYGATDEVHQAFVPFRTATWLDWVADTAGAIIGALTAQRLMERRAKSAIS
jgi:VanZ family protein